jgi:hypothetical protein
MNKARSAPEVEELRMSAIAIAEAARASENRISTKETIEIRSLCLLPCKAETERLRRRNGAPCKFRKRTFGSGGDSHR